ncbi:MAG: dienelactone hydrolase family protein [Pseudomonadota bacterium]
MSITQSQIAYPARDVTCRGEIFAPADAAGPLPIVLVVHAWDGLIDEVRDKCRRLADEGYLAFAVDIYGEGETHTDFSTVMDVLAPYMENRERILARMEAAMAAAKTLPGGDPARIGAMGYCFGGTCVLDLARGGNPDCRGVVSFHGGLVPHDLDTPKHLDCSVLVLHGEDDPMVPGDVVRAMIDEMTAKGVDLQFISYSQTMHAFSRPAANAPEIGAQYNERTDRRAWQQMLSFFKEIL